jgi:5-methylcytosine-specific restriction endonuclease McrA
MGYVTAASVADHVQPHNGDPHLFWYGELQSLCFACHNSSKQRIEHGRNVVRVDVYGAPKILGE